jgi:hypothetical protein
MTSSYHVSSVSATTDKHLDAPSERAARRYEQPVGGIRTKKRVATG